MLDDNNLFNKDVVGIVECFMNLNVCLVCIYIDKDGEFVEGCLKQFREFYFIYVLILDEDKSKVNLINDIQICYIKGFVNVDKEQE